MKITYFGFASNPPTVSHARVIEWLAPQYDLVLVGPSASHAFGKSLPPMAVRMQLAGAMVKNLTAKNVVLTDIEDVLLQERGCEVSERPVYSYDVLVALRKQYPEATIHLAIGPDNAVAATWEKFYQHEKICADFGVVVAPDWADAIARSTLVRKMLKEGASAERLSDFTGSDVAKLLIELNYTGEK